MQWGGSRSTPCSARAPPAFSLKRETTIPYISKRNGVPMSLINSDDEIKAQMAKAQAGAVAASDHPGEAGIDPNAVIGAAQSGANQ